jgi:hypothetical protein
VQFHCSKQFDRITPLWKEVANLRALRQQQTTKLTGSYVAFYSNSKGRKHACELIEFFDVVSCWVFDQDDEIEHPLGLLLLLLSSQLKWNLKADAKAVKRTIQWRRRWRDMDVCSSLLSSVGSPWRQQQLFNEMLSNIILKYHETHLLKHMALWVNDVRRLLIQSL